MPQFTIPLRFYVEYFYDRTNVYELKKEAKTPPDINLNSIYDLIRYGLMNPITSQCGVHYMLLGAKADTYHITVIEGQEQTISIANKFPNHVIITYHCNPIQRTNKEATIIPFVQRDESDPLTKLKIYPYNPRLSHSEPVCFDLLVFCIDKEYKENIVIRLLLDAFRSFQEQNYRYTVIAAHTAYELAAKKYFKGLANRSQFKKAKKFLTNINKENISAIATKYLPLLTSLTNKPMPLDKLSDDILKLTQKRNSLNHDTLQVSNNAKKELRDCLISTFLICKYFELEIPDKDYSEFLQ